MPTNNIPDEVKTSIVLEDNVSPACNNIMESIALVVSCFGAANDFLEGGLKIDSKIDENAKNVINSINEIKREYTALEKSVNKGLDLKINKEAPTVEKRSPLLTDMYLPKESKYYDTIAYKNELFNIKQKEENLRREGYNNKLLYDEQKKEMQLNYLNQKNLHADLERQQKLLFVEEARKTNEGMRNDYIVYRQQMLNVKHEEQNIKKEGYFNKLRFEEAKNNKKINYLIHKNLQADLERQRKLQFEKDKFELKENMKKNKASRTYEIKYIPVENARIDLYKGINRDIRYNGINQNIDITKTLNKLSGVFKYIFNVSNIRKAIDTSDMLSQLKSRIELLNKSFKKASGISTSNESVADYIYKSSNNARTGYFDMIEMASNLGTYSKDVFDNQKEVIDFTNLLLKLLRTNGLSNTEALSVITQITTTMNRGILKGYELLSLFRKAPSVIEMITRTMEISEEQLEEMSRDRGITARALKDVIFANNNEINKNFEKIPMTWKDILTRVNNTTIKVLEPVLDNINKLANDKRMISNIDNTIKKLTTFVGVVSNLFIKLVDVISSNWDIISPVILSIIAVSTIAGIIEKIIAFVKAINLIKSSLTSFLLLFTNPYIAGISLATLSFILLGKSILETSKKAKEASEINLTYYDVLMSVFTAYMYNIKKGLTAFLAGISGLGNQIVKIFSTIFDMSLATYHSIYGLYLKVKSFLPFTSTTSSDANDELQKSVKSMKDFFDDLRLKKAFNEGVEAVFDEEKWSRKLADVFRDEIVRRYTEKNVVTKLSADDYSYSDDEIKKYLDDMLNELKNANNSLGMTEEEIKYMRDIAERDAINRYTTAEIKVDMTNNNNISSEADIDFIVDALAGQIEEAMNVVAEGVH